MTKDQKDLGFGAKVGKGAKRMINKDGSFNVRRIGTEGGLRAIYEKLVLMKSRKFFLFLVCIYFALNLVFASIYLLIGVEHIQGANPGSFAEDFSTAFNFSFQTLTTVGYGALSPDGFWMNLIASAEALLGWIGFALLGWIGFALATGLVYGRFSKPSAKIVYSNNLLLAPYEEGKALMFRIANKRSNILMDMSAQLFLVLRNVSGEKSRSRRFYELNMEINKLNFMPLSWTIVHPIKEGSPLYGKTKAEILELGFELLILIKGYDDTFNKVIHSRYSYTASEIIENAKFRMAFDVEQEGEIQMSLDGVHLYDKLED